MGACWDKGLDLGLDSDLDQGLKINHYDYDDTHITVERIDFGRSKSQTIFINLIFSVSVGGQVWSLIWTFHFHF